ncbi:MAG: hypothetical protein ACK46E_10545, partial [Pseudanabaena sp.]
KGQKTCKEKFFSILDFLGLTHWVDVTTSTQCVINSLGLRKSYFLKNLKDLSPLDSLIMPIELEARGSQL